MYKPAFWGCLSTHAHRKSPLHISPQSLQRDWKGKTHIFSCCIAPKGSMVYQKEEIYICPGSLQSVGLVGLSSSCLPSVGSDWLSGNVSL